ncbi:DNA polymerase-4 [Paenibacillus sp. 1182]|uniref:DNA polymerase IV n=1 Tax=Paenibacillus sp. 1182 TaxID=2806565 RepID=UPI001AE79A38|nr:DNA polymerase IV [Paenibacillus sp. 1182]MBP1308925.1 DNA polymerase-4 [Paenibacillus sp. 1182]
MSMKKVIFLIDMQSFYASVEKSAHPEWEDKPLVVAGDPERRSGIILAACPLAKKYGVSTAEPIWQALQKCPHLMIVRPHMERYIEVSLHITNILKSYSDLVESYSIDELFVDVTGSLHFFNHDPIAMARHIQNQIKIETGVYSRVGIGENKVLAKLSCDLIAKKNKEGIFILHKNELEQHIWDKPVRDMWGIGSRMQKHLNRMGIYTIGGIAKTSVNRFRKKWGVNGEVIWRVANGIDNSPVSPYTHDKQKMVGNGMTLPKDYCDASEIDIVLLDLCSQVCRRLRAKNVMASVVSVGAAGADFDYPTGFSRQVKLSDPTDATMTVYEAVKRLFHTHWDKQPVRRLHVSLSDLSDADVYQLSFFNNNEKQRAVDKVMDQIKDRFGEVAILRASSFMEAGQAIDRAAKIGGHYK